MCLKNSQEADAVDVTDLAAKRRYAGPVKNRSCTDIPCFVIFLIFVLGFVVLTLWSFAYGDYRRVLFPTNSRGQVCGRDVPNKPYLVFFDLTVCHKMGLSVLLLGCPTPQVCVKSCPNYRWSWASGEHDEVREKMICLNGESANAPQFVNQSIEALVHDDKCAPYILESKAIFGRCLPSNLSQLLSNNGVINALGISAPLMDAADKVVNATEVALGRSTVMYLTDVLSKVIADLITAWHVIAISLAVALVFSFLWVGLLRCCASGIVWSTLLLFVIIFAGATGFCFYRWSTLQKSTELKTFEFGISYYLHSANTWLAFGIIALILLVIILLVLIFLRKRIRIAIAILEETSRAVANMTSVLFWPVIPMLLTILVVAHVAFVAISLWTIVDPVGNRDPIVPGTPEEQGKVDIRNLFKLIPCDPVANSSAGKACRFIYYGSRQYTIYLQFFNLFMFFWLLNFVKSWSEMTLAGAFAELYYSPRRGSGCRCTVLRSFAISIFYHLGSLAFGSFMIALLQWLRALLEYVEHKVNKYNNGFTRCLFKCCGCFLWCLERFLRFLSRNAFIMIAIYGSNFCTGAKGAYNLLSRNLLRLMVVDKVTDFVLFIGKLVVVGSTTGLAYLYLDGILFADTVLEHTDLLHYVWVPLAFIILGSYLIAASFSRVFEMGVDTIFLCFLNDLEKNNGSAEKPYFMNKNLMNILGKENQPPKPSKKKQEGIEE